MSQKETVVAETRRLFSEGVGTIGLAAIGADRGRSLRKFIISGVQKSITGTSSASAASAYNTVKREKEDDGTLPKGIIGRKPAESK